MNFLLTHFFGAKRPRPKTKTENPYRSPRPNPKPVQSPLKPVSSHLQHFLAAAAARGRSLSAGRGDGDDEGASSWPTASPAPFQVPLVVSQKRGRKKTRRIAALERQVSLNNWKDGFLTIPSFIFLCISFEGKTLRIC